MSRVITFSLKYPSYHPKAGQPTYFVEKIWASLNSPVIYNNKLKKEFSNFTRLGGDIIWPKHHTIRAGHRFKEGDWFSPRVWAGRPYNSKQIIIGPDTQVKKTWDFKIYGGKAFMERRVDDEQLAEIARNDGLALHDLIAWFHDFSKPLDGQIICWNESIEY